MVPITKKLTPFLTLRTVHTDKFKTERISISVCDSKDARRTPIQRFVFSLLKRGSVNYPTKRALNIRMDHLYSANVSTFFNVGGTKTKIGLSAEILGDEYTDGSVLDETLELLFEIFREPVLDDSRKFLESYIESERENICYNIKSIVNNPRAYAIKRFFEVMYKDDPLSGSASGTVELIESVTADELMEVYRDTVKNLPYEVFYVGNKKSDEIESLILKYFEGSDYGKAVSIDQSVSCEVDTKRVKRVDEQMHISQGQLVVGFKTGVNICSGKDFYSMLTLNEIYGASPVSKLFMNVREKLGLCYYCSSGFNSAKGCIYVSSGIDIADRKKAEKEIIKQLEKIKKGKISTEEFVAAKKSLFGVYTELTDSPAAIERFYLSRNDFGISETIDQARAAIEAVSLEDVIRVSEKITLDTVYFLSGDGEEGEGFEDD